MAHTPGTLSPQELGKLANLQVLARQVVEGFCAGQHRSPHKGFSVEFKQHRPYVPGDELRRLDWKVWGKTDRLFIREYEEETNLRCNLLVDTSGSMAYAGTRSEGLRKHDYAARLAAALGYLLLRQQDAVGLVTFDTRIRRQIPPRGLATHLTRLTDTLEAAAPGGETDPARVFHELVPKIRRRGMLIVISDCFGDPAGLLRALAHFRQKRHEVIVFQVWDPDELEFPFDDWTRFESLEQSGVHEEVDPGHLRKAYMANLERFRRTLRRGCRRHRVSLVEMRTDQPLTDALAEYLALRRRQA